MVGQVGIEPTIDGFEDHLLIRQLTHIGIPPGNRTPICGFGDRRNAIIPGRY